MGEDFQCRCKWIMIYYIALEVCKSHPFLLPSLSFTEALEGSSSAFHPRFIDEETEAQRVSIEKYSQPVLSHS